jgi:hypothetical protein
MVQVRAGHLRIVIHESKRNSLCIEYADLLQKMIIAEYKNN